MLRLTVFSLVICACGNAQFSGLATNSDGSRVYFATGLRQKNTTQSTFGKIFAVDSTGLKLFLSREAQIPTPPPPGTFPIPLTNAYNLQAARISSDGKIFAAVGIEYCSGAGEFCTRAEPYVTTISAAGQDKDYPGDLRLSGGGTWAFGVSGVAPTGIYTGYLVNVATGQQTAIGGVFGRFQVAASGRPVADDGTAVYSDFGTLVVVHGSETRHIPSGGTAGGNAGMAIRDAVIDRAGTTIVFADCALPVCSLRLADSAGSGSSLLIGDGFAPALSDDGKTLLYLSTRTGTPQIRIAHLNGGVTGDRQLGSEVGGVTLAALSGDGSTVYAVTKNGRLVKISVSTNSVQELIPRTAYVTSANSLAPGKLVAIAGGGLTDLSFNADSPLPESLHGISVTIQGMKARILSVTPDAIMTVVPPDVTPSTDASLTSPVEITLASPSPSPFDDTQRFALNIAPFAPEFVTGAGNQLVAAHQDWSGLVTSDNPARPGEAIHAYGLGLGPTSPAVPYGSASPAEEPFARLATPFGCNAGNAPSIPVEVFFQGLAPSLVAVYQFDFRVPLGTPNGVFVLNCVQDGIGSAGPTVSASLPVAGVQ